MNPIAYISQAIQNLIHPEPKKSEITKAFEEEPSWACKDKKNKEDNEKDTTKRIY